MTIDRRGLKLVRGGHDLLVGSTRVVVSPRRRQPFPIDAVVEEEDTWLVLSAPPEVRMTEEPPIRLMTSLLEARPREPGSVVVRARSVPVELLAVVHDLDRDPSWREEWVVTALDTIFEESRRRGLCSLTLPVLGAVHGRYAPAAFGERLVAAFARLPTPPRRIWLRAEGLRADAVLDGIRSNVNGRVRVG